MTKKIWTFAFLLLAGFLLFTSFNNFPSTTASNIAGNESAPVTVDDSPIVIGYSNWAGWWPWAIAESEGIFAKHGLNVELKWYDDYSKSLEDLAAGAIDGNCQTLSDTISFAAEAAKGEVIVLVNDNSAGNDKIIAAAGINNVSGLKGKEIAIEAGVVDDFLLTLALEEAGMSRQDVKILDVETGAAAAAFAAGRADAVGAFPPFWLEALKRKGSKEIVSSKDFPGAIPDLLVVTEDLASSKPEQVQALVDSWFYVVDFMQRMPLKSDQIMADRAGVTAKELQLFKEGVEIFGLPENITAFKKREDMTSLHYASRQITDFLGDNLKDFEKEPNLKKIFDDQFVFAAAKK